MDPLILGVIGFFVVLILIALFSNMVRINKALGARNIHIPGKAQGRT